MNRLLVTMAVATVAGCANVQQVTITTLQDTITALTLRIEAIENA